jgi:hypothetical protein
VELAQDDIRFLLEGLNTEVELVAQEALEMMIYEIAALDLRDSDQLFQTIKVKVKQLLGVPDSIGYTFPRTGIYPIKGAGRGYGGASGSKWRTSKGETRRTNAGSLGKAGSGPYKVRDWFNKAFDILEQRLSDVLEEKYGEATIKSLKV